jgi:hypothetical protein
VRWRAMCRTSCAARRRSGIARRGPPPRSWRRSGGPGSEVAWARDGRRSVQKPRAFPASGRSPPRPREKSSSFLPRSRTQVRGQRNGSLPQRPPPSSASEGRSRQAPGPERRASSPCLEPKR